MINTVYDQVTDFAFGSNMAGLAIVTFFMAGNYFTRQIVTNICVLLWSFRLAIFLLVRIIKVCPSPFSHLVIVVNNGVLIQAIH